MLDTERLAAALVAVLVVFAAYALEMDERKDAPTLRALLRFVHLDSAKRVDRDGCAAIKEGKRSQKGGKAMRNGESDRDSRMPSRLSRDGERKRGREGLMRRPML